MENDEFKIQQKMVLTNSAHKKRTRTSFYQPGEYHDYFRRIPFIKLVDLLNKLNINLTDKKIHIASCGTGIDLF